MKKLALILGALFSIAYASSYNYPTTSQPTVNPGRILAAGEHQIFGLTSDGTIELQNMAKFKVHPSDVNVMRYWEIYDHITFTPNSNPLATSEFYVTNLDRNGEYVRADLFGGPFYDHPATDRIDYIDFTNCEVVLVNANSYRTRWAVEPGDMHLLKSCQRGETALIGTNDNWFSWVLSSAPYVLVSYENTEFFPYVRCTPKPY